MVAALWCVPSAAARKLAKPGDSPEILTTKTGIQRWPVTAESLGCPTHAWRTGNCEVDLVRQNLCQSQRQCCVVVAVLVPTLRRRHW